MTSPTPPPTPPTSAPPAPFPPMPAVNPYANPGAAAEPKSFVATWLLALLVGWLGIDRFYLGKEGTGILKLITIGGYGIWWLIDLILVLTGSTRDKAGRPLEGFEKSRVIAWIVTAAVIGLSLIIGVVNGATAGAQPDAVAPPAIESSQEAVEPAAPEPEAEAPAAPSASEWANGTFGEFAPIVQSGVGDNIVALPTGATGGIVIASHAGSCNFAVMVLDATNASTGELLVNTIGAYQGTTPWGITAFSEGVNLQITADGEWTVQILPMGSAPALAPSGTGDAVFVYDGPVGALAATHAGSSNFAIIEEVSNGFSMGLLVNEIGAYSGTVPLSAGPSVIVVTADGAWTLVVQ